MSDKLKPCPNPTCQCPIEGLCKLGPTRGINRILCPDCGVTAPMELWNALPRQPQWVAFSPEAIEPYRDKTVLIRTRRADGVQVIEVARPCLFHYGEDGPIWDWSTAYSDWPCQDSDYFMELPTIQEDSND